MNKYEGSLLQKLLTVPTGAVWLMIFVWLGLVAGGIYLLVS